MNDPPPVGGVPLRRRLLVITAACAVMALAALAALLVVTERRRTALAEASRALVEEQRVADQVIAGVMRELALSSSGAAAIVDSVMARFDVASASVHAGLRSYLFRSLTVEERLQIERIKEEHERLEVAARRLLLLPSGPVAGQRVTLRGEVVSSALLLLDEMSAFFRLRESDLARAAATQAATIRWFWFASAATAALVGLGVWLLLTRFLQRRVVTPLAGLADAAHRIGAGDLSVRIPLEGDRELRELAVDFNLMTERLSAAQGSLASRNAELESALALVRRTQDDLVQAEKLGAIGRMSAGLAHELNNPLASVVGNAELLAAELRERGELPAPLARELVDALLREATRARQLVRSLLQFSRQADAGITSVALADALAVVVDLRAFAFQRRGMRLVIEPVPEVWVRGEQQRLQAVFMNIINNALQAMAPAGRGVLRIRTLLEGDTIEVQFDDDGPGIARPDRVFEPFYTTKDPGEGTGLGLSLAARFVESFGGQIRATNRPEGGARLAVRLRRVEPMAAEVTAVADAGSGPGTVLVVEDEAELRRLQDRLLRRAGLTVLTAGNLVEAKARIATEHVDAIVSDVRMPGGSGVDLYRWVEREHPRLSGRFLFVTGDVDVPELGVLVAARPGLVLHKPFGMAEYVNRVRAVLAN